MINIIFLVLFAIMACISAIGFVFFLLVGIIESFKDSTFIIPTCFVCSILAGSTVGFNHLFDLSWQQNINNIKSSAAK